MLQNNILRTIANVAWYVTNSEINEHREMNTVQEEIKSITVKYQISLKSTLINWQRFNNLQLQQNAQKLDIFPTE